MSALKMVKAKLRTLVENYNDESSKDTLLNIKLMMMLQQQRCVNKRRDYSSIGTIAKQ